jgi:hypothetical protein
MPEISLASGQFKTRIFDGMTQVVTISASTAASAFEALRIPQRVPANMVAKEARKMADRQIKGTTADEFEETPNIIQSTEVALDLMSKGNKQPQAGLQQALKYYEDV